MMNQKDYDSLLGEHEELLKQAKIVDNIKNDPSLNMIYQEMIKMNQRITEL